MTRAVLYLRISSSDEASSALDRQEKDLRKRAADEGWSVVRKFEDEASGGFRRSNAEQALAMLRDGEADVLLVWRLDRWGRMGIRALADLDEVLTARPGTRFVSHLDRLDSRDRNFRLLSGVLAAVAREELDVIRDRVHSSIAEMRQVGWFSGGNVPYGYRSIAVSRESGEPGPQGGMMQSGKRKTSGRVLTINEDEAAVVREAAERVLSGESVYAVSRDFNARGIPTRRGTTWTVQSLRQILTGDAILGRVKHRGELLRDEDGLPRTVWTAVLGLEDWSRLRHRLGVGGPVSFRGPRSRRARLLSGLATCGLCGATLYVRVNGAGHPAYGCSARSNGRPCAGVSISAAALERYVVDWLLDSLGDLDLEREIVEPGASDAELAEIDRALKATTADMLEDDADIPSLTARLAALKKRRSTVRAAPSEPAVTKVSLEMTLREAWERLDPGTHQAALRSFFREIDISVAKGRRGSRTFDPSRVTVRAGRPTLQA